MSGFYKKAVVWLGLNEEYPDDVASNGNLREGDGSALENGSGSARRGPAAQSRVRPMASSNGAHASDPLAASVSEDRDSATVRAVPMDDQGSASGTVRAVPLPRTVKPESIVPSSFNHAQAVADIYKDSKPVVVDLVNAERDLARRLIDFSAGLCYGLGGRMEKLATDVYLLVPEGVEVADGERSRFA